MDEANKVGNAGNTTASTEGKASDQTSTDNAGKVSATAADSSAKIAELQTRLDKEMKEKEIYRAGLLAAKDLGKKAKRITQEELEDPSKLEEVIDAKIQEKEVENKAVAETIQKVEEMERLRKENEELRRAAEAATAASGSGGSASMGSGHNEHSESKPTGYWSDAQKNELRSIYTSRGFYSSEQIEKMVKKAEEIAQKGTALKGRENDLVKTRTY